MKKYLSILLLALSTVAYGQLEGFTSNNRQVIWQNIYETSLSFDNIKDVISKNKGIFKDIAFSENSIDGLIENVDADYKGAGYTFMGTDILLSNSAIQSHFTIDYKEGKYRVTLSKIEFKTKNTINAGYGLNMMSSNGVNTLEPVALRNGKDEFKSGFEGKFSKTLNYTFKNLFELTKYKKSEDNW
ncbi:hypothetical protein [Elizabethkingia miricola]|uniref:hypothetical protein n=1 Tax=Elizabethkingia miricola TaxID=172045 RepID=UPI000B359AD3|nr:hypothetical protein [Elizabethkingia miricola]NHQ66876.1 hypothetical protein [Elizabethkingia miricola]NHQ70557.1 hypothetical protein [Elizabethkingia miricola]NHQ77491.1 hypothetical protein [Elizabethkingia miricola]PSL88040.1 hypothetical protein C7V10_11970 [Elizabethkingia miricola]QHQ86011.1 hypothetical protein FE632_04065 [Elizabethkingia miricola]